MTRIETTRIETGLMMLRAAAEDKDRDGVDDAARRKRIETGLMMLRAAEDRDDARIETGLMMLRAAVSGRIERIETGLMMLRAEKRIEAMRAARIDEDRDGVDDAGTATERCAPRGSRRG